MHSRDYIQLAGLLQSCTPPDNRREFMNMVVDKLHTICKDVKIVMENFGNPRPKVYLKQPKETKEVL